MLTINSEIVKVQRQSNECFTERLRFTLNRKMKQAGVNKPFCNSQRLDKRF